MVKRTQTIRGNFRRIVWLCLTILWDWRLKVDKHKPVKHEDILDTLYKFRNIL